jgi:voltage-gated potassium channel
VTVAGQIAASLIAIAGIGVVALPTGIFASAFAAELRAREKTKRTTQSVVEASSENAETRRAAQPSSD